MNNSQHLLSVVTSWGHPDVAVSRNLVATTLQALTRHEEAQVENQAALVLILGRHWRWYVVVVCVFTTMVVRRNGHS